MITAKLYAQWQKSLNVPRCNGRLRHGDQAGGTFNNEANLTLGIPLPLWKANQGNVEKANYAIQQNQKKADFQEAYPRNQSSVCL